MRKKILTYLAIIISVIAVDQLTKGFILYLITGGVPLSGSAWEIVPVPYLMAQIFNFFNIVFTWNPGTSFSMFRALGESAPLVMIIFTGVIIGCIGYYAFVKASSYEKWPLALILGGAIGNLIDRIRFGAVIDFLDFHIGALHWPAFNIADACIVVGVGLYILNWLIARRKCINSVKTKGDK